MAGSVVSDYGVISLRGVPHRDHSMMDAEKDSLCAKSDSALMNKRGKKVRSAEAKGQAYYRQGVALQCMGRYGEALAAFSQGLALDSKSSQLLAGLVETVIKSPLKSALESTFMQLQAMRLDKSAFVIMSVIGQELLAAGSYSAAIIVLDAALKIGTCSLKLRGSVFSALSSAYWAMNSLDKAMSYMQQDLSVAKSLGDIAGECRAHGNLGSAFFSKGNLKEALTSHRYQLVLAMKCKDTLAAAAALTSLGHVYTAIGDYPNALASHKQCVQLVRQLGDCLQEAREIGNVGAVYLAMGDFENAVDCHLEHLRISKQMINRVEEARAFSNLGSSHHYKRNFEQAITYHNHVLLIAQELQDRAIEARAYAGLGHAARCMADYSQARRWHEKQLDVALNTKDRTAEGRACTNLGIVYQLLGDHDAALKLHQAHLNIARALHDRAGMGRAYGNIGNAYSSMGYYEQAIKYHKQELTISKEVNDRSSEASTHGNLAVAYQALGMHEMALLHYLGHLNIARELKDTPGEACALCNLGNCHSSRGQFGQAAPYYEQYLMLSQELQDVEGEARACHFLGYAHYCLGNYKEAIHYYEQDLTLAKDLQDRMNMGRAYCNLGLAHVALLNFEKALECQKFFFAIANMLKHAQGTFRALGNIGDVLMRMQNHDEAISYYHKQLVASKKSGDRHLEACSYGALGRVHRSLRHFDKSLGFHTQELTIRQEMADLRGECKAHAHLGAVHMSLTNYTNAIKCYEEQLERANELRDLAMKAQAYGNLGIARLNMSHFEDAIGFFEQQLAALEQLQGGGAPLDKAQCFGNLADCHDAIGDSEQAVRLHEQYLSLSLKLKAGRDQEKAYRGLGSTHMRLGNLQQALVCCEKRLVVAHELNNAQAKASAYGELGLIHGRLANYEQALACLDHQLNIAKELSDAAMEGQAAGGLGSVHQLMGELDAAMRYHQLDLDVSQSADLLAGQVRALGQLGATCEARGQLQQAADYWERQLSAAEQLHDLVSRTAALAALGRVHHALGDGPRALDYLRKALQLSEQLDGREEEARIRQRLGLVLWEQQQLRPAQMQLEQAASLLESVRRQTTGGMASTAGVGHHKLQLYDLQTTAYQTLECVLVALGCHSEALVVAERSRTRALADLLLRRSSSGLGGAGRLARVDDNTATSVEQIVDAVDRQKASVLYYSLAAGRLHVWLVVPGRGIVHFHQVNLNEVPTPGGQQPAEDEHDAGRPRSLLQGYIESVRDALGVEMTTSFGQPASNVDGDGANMWQQHLEDLGDRMNQENDKTGFLRMVNRNHVCNQSNYSLSSMFSAFSCSVAGSLASGTPSRAGSTRSRRALWQGPQCLRSLYELLIAPMEQHLPQGGHSRDLMLVLEGDLYLVPFAVLKDPGSSEYLCERYNLILTPAISALRTGSTSRAAKTAAGGGSALVVGNPRLPTALMEQWGWNDIPYSEQEANIVASMLETTPLTGSAASRAAVLQQLCQAECVHLAAHVSWKLSAVVLSPGEWHGGRPCGGSSHDDDQSEEAASSSAELPPFSEFLLTAADILSLKLSAKLVVVSSCHTRDHHGRASSDGVVALTRALLAAGAQCVLFSLWPVADTAVKILYRAFYSSLLQGARASRALNDAMLTVQNTKHFAHPANWSGHVLLGCDVRLTDNVALMGQALCQLLAQPDRCRDALRVCLHLMEKSLQRITRRHKNAMYTTQKSIENKVGGLDGWRELLIAVGFRFEPAAHGIPSSVFFPQSDPGQRLGQCSASLQALLALCADSLAALCKLLAARREHADQLIEVMRRVIDQLQPCADLQTESVSTSMAVELWRVDGCHELLASLGFDLMEVGRDEVHLKTSKTASKRSIQFTLQALLALFDTQEAPKNLEVEFSSSVESSSDEDVQQSSRAPLLGAGGAFCSYVRGRGQPDGARRALPPLVPPPALSSRGLGNESDAAFTPSPVDAHVAHTPPPYHQISPKPSPRLSLSLSHQNRIRSLYQTAAVEPRPGSSGSSNAGGSTAVTALRRPPQQVSSADAPLDKLSVRTELRRAPASVTHAVRSNPPAASMAPSSGADDMSASHGSSIQDHIIATQMSRLRELPITDVYHERSIGLGLAPPLSKLLMSDCTAADDVHDDMATLQKLSISERRTAPVSRRSDLAPTPGKRANGLFTGPKSWSSGGSHHVHDASTTRHDASTTPPNRSGDELPRRDDGDGRSMTDSNYSSYSPSYQSATALVHRHADHKQAFSNMAFETDVPSISVSTRQQSAQIAEYMHQVLGNTDDHIGHVTRRAGATVRGSWTTPKSAARKSLTHSLHPSAEC